MLRPAAHASGSRIRVRPVASKSGSRRGVAKKAAAITYCIAFGPRAGHQVLTHRGEAALEYAGWYPVMRIYGNYGTRASTFRDQYGNIVAQGTLVTVRTVDLGSIVSPDADPVILECRAVRGAR